MNETIGDRISQIVNSKNLKKIEFARILNIDSSYVTQLIKGRNNPSDRLIEDICEKLRIEEKWLRTGEGKMDQDMDRDIAITAWATKITRSDYEDEFVKRFAAALTKLDERDWQAIKKIATSLIDDNEKKD